MIIVLSPAKSLDYKTPPTVDDYTQPEFLDQSQQLIDQLRTLSPVEVAQLMHLSDRLAVLNATRYAEWSRPFSPGDAKQAVLAFNGDVYDGLDAGSLSSADLNFAQDHLRVLSGLYGVLRPLDLMQPYRLEMGTRLPNSRGKDLYAFWGERITDALNKLLLASKAKALINLASEEYFKSVKPTRLAVPVIQPVFEDWSSGKFKVVSFYAKRARGLMARFAISRKLVDPLALQEFSSAGYVYTPSASSATSWVFRRSQSA